MIRVHVICEGHTEEMFTNELLIMPFVSRGIILVPAKIGKPGHKGGNVNYQRLFFDLRQRLLGDTHCYCTTFLDYYGLPTDFPGKVNDGNNFGSKEKLHRIITALSEKVTTALGEQAGKRFLPYIQMYEFEALLFSQPKVLAETLQELGLIESLVRIRQQFTTPEEINDSPQTAPSKRIEKLYNAYDKQFHPLLAAQNIGLEVIRNGCPLFDGWLKRIERLADGNIAGGLRTVREYI